MQLVLDHVPRHVTHDMNSFLDAPFNEEEAKMALIWMFHTKAPSPNSFPAHFFQRNWDVCGIDMTTYRIKDNRLEGGE